jgi:hypothetical protein
MRILKGTVLALCAAGLLTALNPVTNADEWDKKTVFTFPDSVEIPGQILPPGTYVFKLFHSSSDRHIVQIWTEDQRQLIATVMAIPAQRLEPRGHTTITFDERPGNSPMAVRTWFYPGDTIGQEFVYHYPPETNYAYGSGSH